MQQAAGDMNQVCYVKSCALHNHAEETKVTHAYEDLCVTRRRSVGSNRLQVVEQYFRSHQTLDAACSTSSRLGIPL